MADKTTEELVVMSNALSELSLVLAKDNTKSISEKQQIIKDFAISMVPMTLRNISASSLHDRVVDEYIVEASMTMLQNYKERSASITIRSTDSDLVTRLTDNWISKGVKPVVHIIQGDPTITIDLSW